MSNLSIVEYDDVTLDGRGHEMPVSQNPGLAIQNVSFTGTAGQSAAFNRNTRLVRIVADANCRILFGANPTAVSTSIYMTAGAVEYFGVTALIKVSAVAV